MTYEFEGLFTIKAIEEEAINAIVSTYRNYPELLMNDVRIIISYSGEFEHLDFWYNEEHVLNTFFGDDLMKLAMAVSKGYWSSDEEYVRFSDYNLLESFDETELLETLFDEVEDIAKYLVDRGPINMPLSDEVGAVLEDMEDAMDNNLAYTEVQDWSGKVLVTFCGANCLGAADDWREEQVRHIDDEDEAVGILEDLYVIGFNAKDEEIPVEF